MFHLASDSNAFFSDKIKVHKSHTIFYVNHHKEPVKCLKVHFAKIKITAVREIALVIFVPIRSHANENLKTNLYNSKCNVL